MKTKIKNSVILQSGKRERKWDNTTTDFYLCLERVCVMNETTSKDDIIGREKIFYYEII